MGADSVGGFSRIEYLAIFTAIVFGFTISEFFAGWGAMIRARQRVVHDPIHVGWTILTFLLSILIWWGTWTNHAFIGNSIAYFYYSLLLPLLLYLVTVFLFPRMDGSEPLNGREYFHQNAPLLCILYALLLACLVLNSVVFDEYAFFHVKNAFKGAAALMVLSGAFIRARVYLWVLTGVQAVLLVAYLITL